MIVWGGDERDPTAIGTWRIVLAAVAATLYLTAGLWLPRFDSFLVALEAAGSAQ